MSRRKRERGFTIVELLVAICIGAIVLGAIYSMVQTGLKSSSSLEIRVTSNQDVRAALELMAMEIRMASYNPNFATNFWKDSAGNISANQSYKGIQQAGANSMLIEMDITANSAISDANEVIFYNLDTVNKYISRTTGFGGASYPFLGADPGSGQERTVRVINSDLNIPVFTYYDGNGNQIPVASLPANIPNIRRIQIVLAVQTDDVDVNSHQRKTIIYSTSVIPRNHATSS